MKVRGMEDKENVVERGVVAAIGKNEKKQTWNCSVAAAIFGKGNSSAGFVEDEGGGTPAFCGGKENSQQQYQQQLPTATSNAYDNCDEYLAAAANACVAAGYDGDAAAAAAASATANFSSNRTSRNNSTENLSFSSDNFYPDDLLFFQEEEDANGANEVDDISCESDDCVYAYRGDGAELYFPLEAGRPAGIVDNSLDDEMDFLEMDFEPDTLSEVENGNGNSVESEDVGTNAVSEAMLVSGRHSSSAHMLSSHLRNVDGGCISLPKATTQQQRQLYSSPIDNMPAAVPLKALQAQTLLGKNFGRMSLHLDQIKGPIEFGFENVATTGCDEEEVFNECSTGGSGSVKADTSNIGNGRREEYSTSTAHSLPNTLHAFGRENKNHEQSTMMTHEASPSKVTGAKPKRLSTFSTSSSTSSKNSSKSRTSLRSVIGPALPLNSSSFDERSVSCTEFRSGTTVAGATDANASSAISIIGLGGGNPVDLNDESCLDCLEKEFLANTIGKAIEPSNCPKCRRKRFSFFKSEQQQSRCRSGSPSFFSDAAAAGHENFYEIPQGYINSIRKDWIVNHRGITNDHFADIGTLSLLTRQQPEERLDCVMPLTNSTEDCKSVQKKIPIKCDTTSSSKQLLSNNTWTDKEVAISTADANEECLIRILEQFHVAYDSELLKLYFAAHHSNLSTTTTQLSNNSSSNNTKKISKKKFKDLKQFIVHESKKNCNHPRLVRLIEAVTNHQVDVQFKENTNKNGTEFVHVSVLDILQHWTCNNDLTNLKDLDNRFQNANILGKIANIIRQTQTKRITSVRLLPETIAIPQYYPSGFLILREKFKR